LNKTFENLNKEENKGYKNATIDNIVLKAGGVILGPSGSCKSTLMNTRRIR